MNGKSKVISSKSCDIHLICTGNKNILFYKDNIIDSIYIYSMLKERKGLSNGHDFFP
jgi:hypothetical protein